MKKVLSLILTAIMAVTLCFCVTGCGNDGLDADCGVTMATEINTTADYSYIGDLTGKTLSVGAIYIGDSSEGYSKAHIDGIAAAKKRLEDAGATITLTEKKSMGAGDANITTELNNLASSCDIVITNSYGHQSFYGTGNDFVVTKYPNVTFLAMTGDLAKSSGANNYKNAFTSIYQARYISGVIAGLKIKQLIADGKIADNNKDKDGNIKVGYVGAFTFAEVISGYTAFYLGIKSQVSNVVMEVSFTGSWGDKDKEYNTAKSLIADGCLVIGQHADTEGAPQACEEAYRKGTRVYSVGYNVSMLNAAPHAALVSPTNDWEVYYTYAFYTAMTSINGAKAISTDWSKGYADGAVKCIALNGKAFKTDISADVKAVVDQIKAGTLKVFDTSKFTVGGETKTTYTGAYGLGGAEAIANEGGLYYFNESVVRSAPYFDLQIDGITLLNSEYGG